MASPSFDLGLRPTGGTWRGKDRLQPREWQGRLIQLLRARLPPPGQQGRDVLLHAGPGAGKTLGALLGFQRLQREGRLHRFVVFCHRSSIARQWLAAADRLGLDLVEWSSQKPMGEEVTGLLVSYQSAARHRPGLMEALGQGPWKRPWLAIADEVHHLGLDPEEPEATAWGQAFTCLSQGATLRLGLSGTPFRADNLAFCSARRIRTEEGGIISERIVPDLCVEPRRLILAGDVRPLEFHFQDGWVEHGRSQEDAEKEPSPLSTERRESWRARNLRRAIRLGDGGGIALRLLLQARRRLERVRKDHPPAGGLVIARDISHARRIASLLSEEGDAVLLVHSQDPGAGDRLASFQDGEADWLVSVDMCAEGFDAPRLRVLLYLTTVVTRSRFLQAITRVVRVDGTRSGRESIPRDASHVFAPADPLLIGHARGWSLSEPYLIRANPVADGEPAPGAGSGAPGLPLQALGAAAGEVIRLRGPELPGFLSNSA